MHSLIEEKLFAIVRRALTGAPIPPEYVPDAAELEAVCALAKRHDIAQFPAAAAEELGWPLPGKYRQELPLAVSRVANLEYEQSAIARALENAAIPFVLLKGSLVRAFYPESWMRTSCDIDVLVHEEQLDAAIAALVSALAYRVDGEKTFHDISLFSPSGVHLELHFHLQESIDMCNATLARVWENLLPLDGFSFGYRETPEYFLFHHLAHMAKHLRSGGCGIRPFLDLWLIRKQCACDEAALRALLEEADLLAFTKSAEKLAAHWMENAPIGETEQLLEGFVLTGGVYGVRAQSIAVKRSISGSAGAYLWQRVFMPYEGLCTQYDWLQGRKYLVPAAQMLRWGKLLQKDKCRRARSEANLTLSMGEEQNAAVAALLRDLHLT